MDQNNLFSQTLVNYKNIALLYNTAGYRCYIKKPMLNNSTITTIIITTTGELRRQVN
jgi:hypothetical protein